MIMQVSGRSKAVFILIVIIFAGCFSYFSSLLNPFIWDDIALIVENIHIRDIGYIPRLFLEGSYYQGIIGNFYRPVLTASFSLDYHFWGFEALGYHLTNTFFHLCNSLLIYYLVWLLVRRRTVAFLTAVLFVAHPVHTEAVTYISGRGDPLTAFFSLLSIIYFIRYFRSDGLTRRLFYSASLLFFSLAVFTKESALILPLFIGLYLLCFEKRKIGPRDIPAYIPFFIIPVFYLFMRNIALSGIKSINLSSEPIPFWYRLLTAPSVITEYVKMLLYPVNLHMERMDFAFDFISSLFDPRFITSSVFLAAAVISAFLLRRSSRALFFGVMWFLVGLLPFLNLVPINAFVAEHWLYFPSIGFFLVASIAFRRLLDFKSIRLSVKTFLAVAIILLTALTIKQNYVWRDPLYFYNYTLRYSPASARLHTNLGIEYFNRGLFEKSEREYKEALRIEPFGKNTIYHYLNLAALYYWWGREDDAFRLYLKAIETDPTVPVPYANMGDIYYMKKNYRNAIASYEKAVALLPSNATYWNRLGNSYLEEKMFDRAEDAYKKALAIYPYLLEARINLGGVYAKKGDLVAALNEYKIALEMAPDLPEIYLRVSGVCAKMGAPEQAKYFSDKAKELSNKPPDAGIKR